MPRRGGGQTQRRADGRRASRQDVPDEEAERMTLHFKLTRRAALAGFGAALAAPAIRPSFAQGAPIRVGVLHSLSGTMAISETALRDTVLMMVEWQNSRGGILGRRLEPVVVDPASNWPLFA